MLILMPVRGEPHDETMRSARSLGGLIGTVKDCTSLAAARGVLALTGLGIQEDRFLWLDSDMVFEPQDAVRLVTRAKALDADVLSAHYAKKLSGEDAHATGDPVPGHERLHGGTESCLSVGFGFCVTHRRVFERIAAPEYTMSGGVGRMWFDHEIVDGVFLFEDQAFCRRARAHGFDVRVDYTVRVGHYGSMVRWPRRTEDATEDH